MKTLIKFLLSIACVSLFFACSKIVDQPAVNSNTDNQSTTLKKTTVPTYTDDGTGTYSYYSHIVGNTYEIPVICDGVQIDILQFPVDYTFRPKEHFQNNVETWWRGVLNNVLYTSTTTGEQFKAVDFESGTMDSGIFHWRMNLKGNQGTHYNIQMVFDFYANEMIDIHSICH